MESRQSIVGVVCKLRDTPHIYGKVTSVVEMGDGDARVSFTTNGGAVYAARLSNISLMPPVMKLGREFASIAEWQPK